MDEIDQQAIRQVLSGDRDAYRILMERHFPLVYRVAFRIIGDASDAEDVAQEVFLRGFNKLSTFRQDASFSTWIHRIAMNTALNLVERRNRDLTHRAVRVSDDPYQANEAAHVADTKAGPERLLLDKEVSRLRNEALSHLTLMERNAFVLRHLEELPMLEVAQALSVSVNSAKQAVFRAISKLRRELTVHGDGLPQQNLRSDTLAGGLQ